MEGDRGRTGVGAVKREGEVGNRRVCVCLVPVRCDSEGWGKEMSARSGLLSTPQVGSQPRCVALFY